MTTQIETTMSRIGRNGAPRERIPVGVLGATGAVGQRFVTLLADHPWFEPVALFASEQSAGRRYRDAATWIQETPVPAPLGDLEVRRLGPAPECRILFSALDASVAAQAERDLAAAGHLVVSNTKSHRMDPDVPLVVPEVNPGHLALADRQPFDGGALLTNPNCATIGLALVLEPLRAAFGIRRVRVVTLQALSGAGYPGVASLHAVDNLVPYISGEEEKLETETRKIFGSIGPRGVTDAALEVSAQCNRVPVLDGHVLCLSVDLERVANTRDVAAALAGFHSEPQRLDLPTAPPAPVEVATEPDRPQPRLDRDRGGGMAVTVGRIRSCPFGGFKLVALCHNTIRGAAGGAILLAELAVARGLAPGAAVPAATAAGAGAVRA